MMIKQCDMYQLYDFKYLLLNDKSISNLYCLTILLILRFGYFRRDGVLKFIEKYNNGISFEEIDISINNQENLVYINLGWHDYHSKPTNSEIEKLLEEGNFVELCKIGFLDYIVMPKDNFFQLLLAWNKILDELPPFVLLYQDENDWYDVKSFSTKEEMEQFVVEHTKKD